MSHLQGQDEVELEAADGVDPVTTTSSPDQLRANSPQGDCAAASANDGSDPVAPSPLKRPFPCLDQDVHSADAGEERWNKTQKLNIDASSNVEQVSEVPDQASQTPDAPTHAEPASNPSADVEGLSPVHQDAEQGHASPISQEQVVNAIEPGEVVVSGSNGEAKASRLGMNGEQGEHNGKSEEGFDDSDADEEHLSCETEFEIHPVMIKCGCANGSCGDKYCFCNLHASGCGPSCSCSDDVECRNNLMFVANFLGEAGLRAHPCFRNWLGKQNIEARRDANGPEGSFVLTKNSGAFDQGVLTMMLRDLLLGIAPFAEIPSMPTDPVFQTSSEFAEWLTEWMKKDLSEAERDTILTKLFRLGLSKTEDRFVGMDYFSFCTGRWEKEQGRSHCVFCEQCTQTEHWHCSNCNQCVPDSDLNCEGCGGISIETADALNGQERNV